MILLILAIIMLLSIFLTPPKNTRDILPGQSLHHAPTINLDVCKSLDQRLFTHSAVYVLIIKFQLDVPVLAAPIIHSPCMVIILEV